MAQLTDREFEVLHLLGRGLTTNEIGKQLRLSPKTVAVHRLNIKTKLNLRTVAELIRVAVVYDTSRPACRNKINEMRD